MQRESYMQPAGFWGTIGEQHLHPMQSAAGVSRFPASPHGANASEVLNHRDSKPARSALDLIQNRSA
jgi:hypothetical protein